MKNEIKILIAAIVVILIILVGAFALSGSSPQPSATPTAVPVTVTPTHVPANNGSTGTVTVTPAPTVAPTVTPSPTPTPSPSSGVKQTEFGYWITYPPLDPEKWSTNPPPNTGEWNVVYFDPTSGDVKVINNSKLESQLVKKLGEPAVVHRVGDLNGTVTVGIYLLSSDNIVHGADYEAYYGIWMPGINLTFITPNYYNLTFGPGVTNQTIYIEVSEIHYNDPDPSPDSLAAESGSFNGYVKLDLVEVDGGYHLGSDHEFTLNVGEALEV